MLSDDANAVGSVQFWPDYLVLSARGAWGHRCRAMPQVIWDQSQACIVDSPDTAEPGQMHRHMAECRKDSRPSDRSVSISFLVAYMS